MATYNVKIDFSNLLSVVGDVEQRVMERIHDGVGIAAQTIQHKWQDEVMKAPGIWTPERQAYAQSIKWRYDTHLSATVETTLPLADEIENGRPAKDLKRMLDTSPKVRQGKKGRYLIIPFRHNTPSSNGHSSYAPQMPKSIYKAAKGMAESSITSTGSRASGLNASDISTRKRLTVPQHKYAWGGRLPPGLAPKLKPHHASDPYAGMVRMNTTAGGKKSSAYMTFRVMSETQGSKWIVPAKPGLKLAEKVAREVEQALSDGIEGASR